MMVHGLDQKTLDAVVLDLDGTLVDLPIDWGIVATDVIAIFSSHDATPPGDFWDAFTAIDGSGCRTEAATMLEQRERAAAEISEPLGLIGQLDRIDLPIAVCSLNCESACWTALEAHDVADSVETVIGRDSVSARKPHPEPLLTAIESLETAPERTLFIGDSQVDEETATRAGVKFAYNTDLQLLDST